jgi:hypothetical protein
MAHLLRIVDPTNHPGEIWDRNQTTSPDAASWTTWLTSLSTWTFIDAVVVIIFILRVINAVWYYRRCSDLTKSRQETPTTFYRARKESVCGHDYHQGCTSASSSSLYPPPASAPYRDS